MHIIHPYRFMFIFPLIKILIKRQHINHFEYIKRMTMQQTNHAV